MWAWLHRAKQKHKDQRSFSFSFHLKPKLRTTTMMAKFTLTSPLIARLCRDQLIVPRQHRLSPYLHSEAFYYSWTGPPKQACSTKLRQKPPVLLSTIQRRSSCVVVLTKSILGGDWRHSTPSAFDWRYLSDTEEVFSSNLPIQHRKPPNQNHTTTSPQHHHLTGPKRYKRRDEHHPENSISLGVAAPPARIPCWY